MRNYLIVLPKILLVVAIALGLYLFIAPDAPAHSSSEAGEGYTISIVPLSGDTGDRYVLWKIQSETDDKESYLVLGTRSVGGTGVPILQLSKGHQERRVAEQARSK